MAGFPEVKAGTFYTFPFQTPYGFLANRCRQKKLALCRQLLGASSSARDESHVEVENRDEERERDSSTCPTCKEGQLLLVGEVRPTRLEAPWDTS